MLVRERRCIWYLVFAAWIFSRDIYLFVFVAFRVLSATLVFYLFFFCTYGLASTSSPVLCLRSTRYCYFGVFYWSTFVYVYLLRSIYLIFGEIGVDLCATGSREYICPLPPALCYSSYGLACAFPWLGFDV